MDDERMEAATPPGAPEAAERHLYEMPESSKLAPEEDVSDPPRKPEGGEVPMAPEPERHDHVRPNALHLEGEPITQLSTSRLMAYLAHTGAQPRGLEWINDERCAIVFESYASALEGLVKLQYTDEETPRVEADAFPAPSDVSDTPPEAWPPAACDMLLQPRLAVAFPRSLYTSVEKQAEDELPDALARLDEELQRRTTEGEPVPEIYQDMEREELERKMLTPEQKRLKPLRRGLWLRFALVEHDTKRPRSALRSRWYREHGRNAGKDVVPRLLQVGERAGGRRRRGGRDRFVERERNYNERGPGAEEQRTSRMHAWDDEDYAPPPSLLDRIERSRGDRAEDEGRGDWDEDPYERPRRDRSASPEAVRIRGRGAARAPRDDA